MFSITVLIGACLFSQQGVWETLLAALEVLIRAEHQQQQFNIKQLLNAHVVHHFLLTCQVLQVLFMYLPRYLLQLLLFTNPLLCTSRCHRPANGDFFCLLSYYSASLFSFSSCLLIFTLSSCLTQTTKEQLVNFYMFLCVGI